MSDAIFSLIIDPDIKEYSELYREYGCKNDQL